MQYPMREKGQGEVSGADSIGLGTGCCVLGLGHELLNNSHYCSSRLRGSLNTSLSRIVERSLKQDCLVPQQSIAVLKHSVHGA